MNVTDFIKPELFIVAIACYIIGMVLKQTDLIKDKFIPLVLGVFSIIVCMIYVCSTCEFLDARSVLMGLFTAITQGVLLAGASTYVNQLIKQTSKTEK